MSRYDLEANASESSPNRTVEEEAWFSDRSRESKRLLRTSPTTPPPPIGDDVADSWFR